MTHRQITVSELSDSVRIIDYLKVHARFIYPSGSSLKKAFKRESVLLNGAIAQAGDLLSQGDLIAFIQEPEACVKVFPLDLTVLFEDAFMAVVVKPAGYSVSGNYYKTIQNALPYNLKLSDEDDALVLPRPVHRLDKLTSGILLIAKTRRAQQHLGTQFENQTITKKYTALVKGKMLGKGSVESAIDHQQACTLYESIRVEKSLSYEWLTCMDLMPKTGRTHQLRIHMSESGHPIVGDDLYDTQNVLKGKGLFLCARYVAFKHPVSSELMSFEIPLPGKFEALLARELRRWKKFNT